MTEKDRLEEAGKAAAAENAAENGGEERDNLARQLAEAETTIVGLREAILRERAEIENQRKRMQRDLEQTLKFANEKLLRELLPVYDGMEHGLAADTGNAEALREGMQLTLRALHKLGEANGLSEVNPLGEPFNSETQQAMNTVPSSEHPPGTVTMVMQKGYVLNGRLLRPALVSVAKEPE
ncbi:MAG TPA: nucleotide exchange factor GrpE [Rhodanobacteraceae bacterium]|nr:nucleotide exchange factor GrpE [Rhodanobacteraceae bacterium]